MENKLEQLTRKLYDEGLSKGRAEAAGVLAEAESEAKKIVSDARHEADLILREAERKAAELKKNTETEVMLASRQSIGRLKELIREMIVARVVTPATNEAAMDPAFIREVLTEVARNWKGPSADRIELKVLLPSDMQERLDEAFASDAKSLLAEGVELQYVDSVKSGFRIGPQDGRFYISFTDADFNALLGEYLRPKVAAMLYDKE